MLEYQLIRSKRRKTVLLQVRHGQVTVRAPYAIDTKFINDFVQQKSAWLRAKILEQQEVREFCDFTQGTNVFFLGEILRLNVEVAKQADTFIYSPPIDDSLGQVLEPPTKQLTVVISERINTRLTTPVAKAKQVKKQLEQYLKQQAEKVILERLEIICQQTSLHPTKTTIRQYRARWGSCNSRGEVSFNYLLMMSPLFVIDYVIVHELCHLEHLNHSKAFWQLVEKFSPQYKVAKQWLKTHQTQLHWHTPV